MESDSNPLWDEYDALPLLPPKRRSWKTELIGAVVVALGFACGILGAKWGGSKDVILATIGAGIALIGAGSFLVSCGGGQRLSKAIISTVGIVMVLGGPYYLLALGFEAPASWSGCVGAVIFFLGLGLLFGRTIRARRSVRWVAKAQEIQRRIQEGEHQAEIDRELKGL
jgi:hypothetical protein